MKAVLATALILALSTAISATPLTAPITRIKTGVKFSAESLTQRYIHRQNSLSLQKRGVTSTSPLISLSNDLSYTVTLEIGTPPQKFNVEIDTGSYATWVNSNLCNSTNCKSTKNFDCEASETCEASTIPFKLEYVDGSSVAGYYIVDQFTIGSLSFGAVLADVIENNDSYSFPGIDGTMGLWYYPDDVDIPILNVLAESKALSQNMFALWLEKTLTPEEIDSSPGGEITFGGLNPNRYVGDITYVENIKDEVWTIPVGGMTVGNTTIDIGQPQAIIDTGTSGMLVSDSVANAVNSLFPGAHTLEEAGGNWVIPCTGNTTTSITFGGFTIDIPYEYLAIQSAIVTDGYCLSSIMFAYGATANISQWLVGNVVLANAYTIFDFGTNSSTGGRIGFAKLAPNMTSDNPGGNTADPSETNSALTLYPSAATLVLQTATLVSSILLLVISN